MSFAIKLIRLVAAAGAGSIPYIGGVIAALVGWTDTRDADKLNELRTAVRFIKAKLGTQKRITDAIIAALPDVPERLREPLEELQYALANPDDPPAAVADKLNALAERFRSPEQFLAVSAARHLGLITPQQRRRRIERVESDLKLLRPDAYATQLLAREDNLRDFLAWARADKAFSIRSIVGRAGAGKTRFALELINALNGTNESQDDAADDGQPLWCGGFVDFEALRTFDQIDLLMEFDSVGPTLIVVDYAASTGRLLRKWLNHLAGRTGERDDGSPVRVLLLDRQAEGDEGWLGDLHRGGLDSSPALTDSFDPPRPITLQPLETNEIRRQLLEDMLGVFAERRHLRVPPLPAPGENVWFDKHLTDEQWQDPLYLMMAAAVAVRSGTADPVVDALSLSRTDLGEALADREIERLSRGAVDTDSEDLRTYLAACVTLGRGMSFEQGRAIAELIVEQTQLKYAGGTGRLIADMADLIGSDESELGAIGPDIVGEAFVHNALAGRKLASTARDAFLLGVVEQVGPQALELLMLLIQDYAEVWDSERRTFVIHWKDVLDWLSHLVDHAQQEDLPFLLAIADKLPDETLVLREKAAEIHQLVVESLSAAEGETQDVDTREQFADALIDLSIRLSDLARHGPALQKAEQALAIYRSLDSEDPERFRSRLARSLGALANRLGESGRKKKALEKAQEALSIRRTLAEKRPDAFLPDLALSLNNLAVRLAELGRWEEALEKEQEAVSIDRTLAEKRPDAFLPNLGASLNTLVASLGTLDRWEEALGKAQEAVSIYRTLAEKRRDAFLPDLALSLNNLAGSLGELGRREEALENAQEAVSIYRTLAEKRPDAFLPELARALGTLHLCCQAARDLGEAGSAIREAIEILTPFFLKLPQAFARLTTSVVRVYVQFMENLGEEPDAELLGPVLEALEKLEEEEEEEQ